MIAIACPKTAVWDIPGQGRRLLECVRQAGHDGDCYAAEFKTVEETEC